MSSSTKSGTVADCSKLVNKSYTDLLNLLNSFDKGATSELTQRLRQVETVIQDLRESVKQIPDIGSEEQKQRDKIKDLYRQIKLKDELIESFGSYDVVGGTTEKKNEKAIQCKHCQSVILLANVGVWVDKTYDIPFPTQQKGVDTRKETLSGFWHVRDMYDFENVGFTNAVDGCKYLTCADCDFGPIGIVDPGSRQNLLTPERIQYKD